MNKQTLVYLFVLLFMNLSTLFAQDVFWASEVLEFSSEKRLSNHYYHLNPQAHKAIQVLYEPNIMPGTDGGTGHAWTPQKPDEIDFIKVKFDSAIHVQQIIIAEAINPSAVYKVYLYGVDGMEYLIKTFEPKSIPVPGRLFHIFIDKTPYLVNSMKVVLAGNFVPGYNGIDALGISELDIPIEINPKVAAGFQHANNAERVSDSVNTKFKEIKPLLTPDGKRMYFSRINYPKNVGGHKDLEDIWYSDLDTITDEWQKAKNAGSPLNNKGPNFICSITPRSYYYDLLLGNMYRGNKMTAGLSIASRHEYGYTDPEPVIIENDENLSEYANYFLANNEQAIVLSVQRRGGYGDRDIHITFKQKNGKWSTPLNLGDVINTSEAEASPYLASDNKTLYFSSEGHLGYGGEDIFISHRLDSTWTNWSEPENLGPAVNTPEDDIFFTLAPNNMYAYFSRGNRENTDVFKMQLPMYQLPDPVVVFAGRTIDGRNNEILPNTLIQFRDKKQRLIVSQLRTDSKGKFKVILPTSTKYRIFAYHKGLVSDEAEMLDAEFKYETDTVYRDIYLYPTEDGKPINLFALLKGKVINGNTNEPIGNVKIVFRDLRNNTVLDEITTDKLNGKYKTDLPIGNLYNISVEAENYVSLENELIDLSEAFEYDTIIHDFKLYPVEVGQRISLDNIYFDFDKATLRPKSRTQLEQVKAFMDKNSEMKIELDGHTCSIGQEDYNQKLSEDRAQAVLQYLVDRGISQDRMTSLGFGETRPIDQDKNHREISKNRRVEFVILNL